MKHARNKDLHMQTIGKRIAAALCAVCIAVPLAACGEQDTETTDGASRNAEISSTQSASASADSESADVSSETEANSEDESTDAPTGKFATLEDFINSDLMKSQMETQNESLEGSGLKAALKAEGSTLIYLFTVEDDAMAELLKSNTESIQSSLDSQASAFEAIARSLIAAVEEIENPIVVVRYVDNAGEEIFSQEFVG